MQTHHLSLLIGRSGSIVTSSVDHPTECASGTIAGGPYQENAPVGVRAFVQESLQTDQGGFLAVTHGSNHEFVLRYEGSVHGMLHSLSRRKQI